MEEILNNILEEIKSSKKATMTIQEAADYTGIGRDKIRELISKDNSNFPYFRVGNRVTIDKNLLDVWLKRASEEHLTI